MDHLCSWSLWEFLLACSDVRELFWWCCSGHVRCSVPWKPGVIPPWVSKTPSGVGNPWICVFPKLWEVRRSFGVTELGPWGPEGDNKKDGERRFPRAWSARTRGNGFKLTQGRDRWDTGKEFLAVWRSLGWNSQRSCGLPIPWSNLKMVEGVGWDEMILKVLPNPNHPRILWWLKIPRCVCPPLEWGWGSSIPNWSRPSSAKAEPSPLCVQNLLQARPGKWGLALIYEGKKNRSASLKGADRHKVPEIVKKRGKKEAGNEAFFPSKAKCCAQGFAGIRGSRREGTAGGKSCPNSGILFS